MAAIKITFEQLPDAVSQISQDLAELKKLLITLRGNYSPQKDQWFDLDELVTYDPEKRSKDTFYGYVHFRKIPYHKSGKKLIFLKSEVDAWLASGRRKTDIERQDDAINRMAEINERRTR